MSNRNLPTIPNYIFLKDDLEKSDTIVTVLKYLVNSNVKKEYGTEASGEIDLDLLLPRKVIESNYPKEVTVLPSIYLIEYDRFISGEKAILIFLVYHSRLQLNYLTLRENGINYRKLNLN